MSEPSYTSYWLDHWDSYDALHHRPYSQSELRDCVRGTDLLDEYIWMMMSTVGRSNSRYNVGGGIPAIDPEHMSLLYGEDNIPGGGWSSNALYMEALKEKAISLGVDPACFSDEGLKARRDDIINNFQLPDGYYTNHGDIEVLSGGDVTWREFSIWSLPQECECELMPVSEIPLPTAEEKAACAFFTSADLSAQYRHVPMSRFDVKGCTDKDTLLNEYLFMTFVSSGALSYKDHDGRDIGPESDPDLGYASNEEYIAQLEERIAALGISADELSSDALHERYDMIMAADTADLSGAAAHIRAAADSSFAEVYDGVFDAAFEAQPERIAVKAKLDALNDIEIDPVEWSYNIAVRFSSDELKYLTDEELLEQYVLAEAYRNPTEPDYSDSDDDGVVVIRPTNELEKRKNDPYFDTVRTECLARGYRDDQLERYATNYRANVMEGNLSSVYGVALNIRLLAALNNTDDIRLYKYMMMSPEEREVTVGFKDYIPGDVQGVEGKESRWDRAYADVSGDSRRTKMHPDGKFEMTEIAVLNEGLPTECRLYSFEKSYGAAFSAHKIYCESDYLGNFEYDPDEWAIGYKQSEKTGQKIPVLRYVGEDLPTTSEYQQKSIAGNWFSGQGFGDAIANTRGTLINFITGADERFAEDMETYLDIPDGVKNLDYTFEGRDDLLYIPKFPSSVISAHAAFKDCKNLHSRWWGYNYDEDRRGILPWHLQDGSQMFYGCSSFDDNYIGDFPTSLRTIQGMFSQCPCAMDTKAWHDWSWDFDAYEEKYVNWSDCPLLVSEELSNPLTVLYDKELNETPACTTSNVFKEFARKEEGERQEFQADFSRPENLEKLAETNPELLDQWKDAKAVDAVVKTEHVLNGDATLSPIDEFAYFEPDQKLFQGLIQRGTYDLLSFAVLKGVVGHATGSDGWGWVAGLGGTAILRITKILPSSFEPIFKFTEQFIPEEGGVRDTFDSVREWFRMPDESDYKAAKDEQMSKYVPKALRQTVEGHAYTAGVIRDDSVFFTSMYNNGEALGKCGALQYVGEHGRSASYSTYDTLSGALNQGERAFGDMLATANQDGVAENGLDVRETMQDYYRQLMLGLESYNMGAQKGFAESYPMAGLTGEKAADAEKNLKASQLGLARVSSDYTLAVAQSMVRMDELLRSKGLEGILTDEQYEQFSQLNIPGVDFKAYCDPANFENFKYNDTFGPEIYVDISGLGSLENKYAEEAETKLEPESEPTHSSEGSQAESSPSSAATPDRGSQANSFFSSIFDKMREKADLEHGLE